MIIACILLLTTNVEATNLHETELFITQNQQIEIMENDVELLEPINPHHHTYVKTTVDATCATDGYTLYECECKNNYKDNAIYKTNHKWSDWQITTQPTFFSNGYKTRSCEYCHQTENKSTGTKTIQNDKIISFKQGFFSIQDMVYPQEEDFGEYYENAQILYNAIINKQSSEIGLFFANDTYELEMQDYRNFKKVFENKVLANKAIILKRSVTIGAFPEGAGLTRINIVPTDILELQELLQESISNAGIKKGITELEAVKLINNWMIKNLSYGGDNSDVISSLKSKQAICSGYAYTFSHMCKYLGIKTEVVTGCVDKDHGNKCYGCHAWSKVLLGNQWYYIDVCWNDSTPQNRYFLTKELWSSRTVFDSGDYT